MEKVGTRDAGKAIKKMQCLAVSWDAELTEEENYCLSLLQRPLTRHAHALTSLPGSHTCELTSLPGSERARRKVSVTDIFKMCVFLCFPPGGLSSSFQYKTNKDFNWY